MSDERPARDPSELVSRLYERAEGEAASAAERFVSSRGFASLLGQMAENAAALTKLSSDAMDLVLRNLRLAGRRDVVRLARQLARTEDKLELVLQELEAVHDRLAEHTDQHEDERGTAATPSAASDPPPGASPPVTPSDARPGTASGAPPAAPSGAGRRRGPSNGAPAGARERAEPR